jgi:hypothetical protein
MQNTERQDVYTRITGQIISSLEQGVRPWSKPWSADNAAGRITRPSSIAEKIIDHLTKLGFETLRTIRQHKRKSVEPDNERSIIEGTGMEGPPQEREQRPTMEDPTDAT